MKNLKNITFFLLLIFFNIGCASQKKASSEIKTSFDKNTSEVKSLFDNKVTIYFEAGFKDSLEIYYNKKMIMREYFETSSSTSFTGKQIELDYTENQNKNNSFSIKSANGTLTEIKIFQEYKIIELSKIEKQWNVIYTNRGPVFE